jgi:hypothetical protein
MDAVTGLTILGSAIGGAKVVEKLLGPTSEYIGEAIKEWTEKKVKNTQRIFKNAEEKLGTRINEPGKVPPKILKGVLEEGAWCEEELQADYFGGILASSRSGVSRDDRGAYIISIISKLSSYQLRTHYLFYHALKQHFNGQDMNIGISSDRGKMRIFIPITSWIESMDLQPNEMENLHQIFQHAIWGLNREQLIDTFQYGNPEDMKCKEAKLYGVEFNPSQLGVEIFLWAYGEGRKQNNDFFKVNMNFKNIEGFRLSKTYKSFN